jgi:peptide/nickel transport system permease protein
MTRFLLSRLLGAGMVLAAMSFVVFALIGLMPGDPVDLMVIGNPDITPEQVSHLREIYGVDTPFPERYWHWVTAALHGDLGFSRQQNRPVLRIIWPALGNTVILTATAFVIATIVAVVIGTLAATRQGSWTDRLISLLAYVGISSPVFWLGLMLIYLFAVTLRWLPAGGMPRPEDGVRGLLTHLSLPVLTLVIVEIGGPTRYVCAAMIEVLGQDFIRTARAKGISQKRLILRHALRNAMIPVTTIIALHLGSLFSGALLTETIFAWNGMGRLIYNAIIGNDYNLALVCLLFTTATILIANILADIAYTRLDPRIALRVGRR